MPIKKGISRSWLIKSPPKDIQYGVILKEGELNIWTIFQKPLVDDLHHVTVNAVKLQRTVEMYQWVEAETKR